MHPEPLENLSPENRAHNANILIQLLSESGLTSALEFDSTDILAENNLTKVCLLTVHLWMKLHTRNCSAVRNFTGKLGETEIKELQLKNMYDYPISYQLQFLGPGKNCFRLIDNDELITIKPKDSKIIKIQAGSRMMGAQEAILFINMVGKKNGPPFTMTDILTSCGPVSTESFSFCLRIEPEFIQPTEVFEFSADLYSCLEIDIPVKCPFSINPNLRKFDIKLFPDSTEKSEEPVIVGNNNRRASTVAKTSNTNTKLFTSENTPGSDQDKLTSFYRTFFY